MNLLHDPWMPVRDSAGQRHWITPDRLAESQWRAFDADRPDFNGALAQFAIGLLQTTTPVGDIIKWGQLYKSPPDAVTLRQWFEPVTAAFMLDGDGPRFMQDLDLGSEGVAVNNIGALLIESPGEQTLKNNADHFVKRAQVNALCPACAALALFTLQLNAPSGGAGHRTGLRGGGPLTTLVLAPGDASLWHNLWLNVRDRPAFLTQGGNAEHTEPQRSFPWLGPVTALQALKGEIAQAQVHPAHLFWAMPRRIRLESAQVTDGTCDCCGRPSQSLFSRYATKNYGFNYKGEWSHPFSPYRKAEEGWLPFHPQSDGLGYHHWLAWVLGAVSENRPTRVAQVVNRAVELHQRTTGGPWRLWAFGYDMDNMKACCWYESTLPVYGLGDCDSCVRSGVKAEVGRWLDAADLCATALLGAVRDSWFEPDPKKSRARSEKLAHVTAEFWSATEPKFYGHLFALINAAATNADHPTLRTREAWHALLTRTALHLFESNFVGTGAVERQNPRRAALAHHQLEKNLNDHKLRAALGLSVDSTTSKPERKSTKRAAKEAA